MAQSENSKRTAGNRGGGRGGRQGGGQDYDYSGGNLKYGTGKYTQRENDGYQGGVNISKNGRSMQDNVYREDRENVDRSRGRPGRGNDFGSRMDEIDDIERGMGGGMGNGMGNGMGGGMDGPPREGMRDRMMRNRGGGGRNGGHGGSLEDEMYDMDEFGRGHGGGGPGGPGAGNRMGGGGLLRDLQDVGGRNRDGYDDFGSRGGNSMNSGGKVMGGSSKGRGGGYRSSQFQSNLTNERRRYEEYGFRMEDYMEGGDIIDESGSRIKMGGRRRPGGGASNFDRRRDNVGDGGDYFPDEFDGMGGEFHRHGSRGMAGGMDPYRQGSQGMGGGGMDSFRQGGRVMGGSSNRRRNGNGNGNNEMRGGRGGRQQFDDYNDYGGGDYGDDFGDDFPGGRGRGGLLRDMPR